MNRLFALWPEVLMLMLVVVLAWPLPVRIAGAGEWMVLESARQFQHSHHWLPHVLGEPVYHQPPLWSWLVGMLQGVAGQAPMVGRVFSALLSMGIVGLTYGLATVLFQRRWLSCLSVLLLLTLGPMVGLLGTATPQALTTLSMLGVSCLWLPQQSKRRQSLTLQWGVTGALLAMAHFSMGILADLVIAVIIVSHLPRRGCEWLALSLPITLLSLAWAVTAGMQARGLVDGLSALMLWQPLSFTWAGFASNALLILVPWGLFFLPHPEKKHTIRDWLKRRIWPLLIMGLLTCGLYPVTAFSPMAPFLALWLAQYLGVDANHPKLVVRLRKRVDWSMSLLIVLALVGTAWVFQYLPAEAYWPYWHLPGVPFLKDLDIMGHPLELKEAFPLWKVWLLPIPVAMVGVATVACLLSWWERFERSVLWMTGGILCLVVLVRVLALPVLWPSYEAPLAMRMQLLQSYMKIKDWSIPEARLNPVKYAMPLIDAPTRVGTGSQTRSQPSSRHQVGLVTEAYYYEHLFPRAKLYERLPEIVNMPRLILYTLSQK